MLLINSILHSIPECKVLKYVFVFKSLEPLTGPIFGQVNETGTTVRENYSSYHAATRQSIVHLPTGSPCHSATIATCSKVLLPKVPTVRSACMGGMAHKSAAPVSPAQRASSAREAGGRRPLGRPQEQAAVRSLGGLEATPLFSCFKFQPCSGLRPLTAFDARFTPAAWRGFDAAASPETQKGNIL